MNDVSRILTSIDQGNSKSAEQLLPLVYDELRKLAARKLTQEKPGQTLQPTALVHEVYLRLVADEKARTWNSRGHFFAAAAEAMRRILVENARKKGRVRHGGGLRRERPNLEAIAAGEWPDELLALDEALERFAAHDPVKARLVELRFFGGLTLEQAALCLGISLSTAGRAWRYARAWLGAAMAGAEPEKNI
jgi:RNA polymerase sigma factor (TIGR02999 family)